MKQLYSYSWYSLRLAVAAALFVVSSLAQDSALRILEQPKPELPKGYGTLDVTGTVLLKVEFLGNGEVGNVSAILRMPFANLTELAIDAARKIEFQPEVRGGRSAVTNRLIQYGYSWDGFWKTPIVSTTGQTSQTNDSAQAEAVIQKAIKNLGGEKYLNVKSQIGRGKFSILKEGVVVSFQTFVDVIVFPDKERTDFKASGVKSVQTNVGETGWVYDGDQGLIKIQDEKQIENFKRGIRTSLDYLLRGHWRGEGGLSYVGKRPATLGRRNEVIKVTYTDGLVVEYEFAANDGLPQKSSYKRLNADKEEVIEQDRYAQFVDVGGIRTPFIIDRFSGGVQVSRINYQTVEFNKSVPDSIFNKPANAKELKDLKL